MPKKSEKNLQLMTWTEAANVIKRLVKFGIPVSNTCEISNESGRINVSDESWFDDGQPHQFVATIWKLEQNLALVDRMLDGTFNGLYKLAVASFPTESSTLTYTKALSAITDLSSIREGLDSICSKLNTL